MEKKAKVSYSAQAWLAWFGRLILFLCTAGYVYPHVLTEGMDMDQYDEEARKILE